MNFQIICYVLGSLLIFLAASMLFPLAFSVYYSGPDTKAMLYSILLTASIGALLWFFTKAKGEIGRKEGFAIVTLGWVFCAAFGALPYLFSGIFHEYATTWLDVFAFCYFESMSGFTTTGASALSNIEVVPYGILFWRSLSHWLGGMGIIVLSIAILPILGVGGMQLYQAEIPGPQKDRLTPRITTTAKLLWGVYVGISGVETLLLCLGGMSLFESLCHTFGTMATGGFSTRNKSIGAYNSLYFEGIIILFMIIAGTNFSLHYRALHRDFKSFYKDDEFRFYLGVVGVCILLVFLNTFRQTYAHIGEGFRASAFQVVSIVTTTGYATADFETWPAFSQFLLVVLMFTGGCAGSTGGSMKHVRILLLLKQAYVEMRKLIHPQSVIPLKLNGKVVPPGIMTNILGFFLLFMTIFMAATAIMTALGLDLITAASSVAATLGNIGPGLGAVGPTEHYAHIPTLGKFLLSFCMLVGRLEIYTVLVLFLPSLWQR